jgi:L-malate glycosyltransferase
MTDVMDYRAVNGAQQDGISEPGDRAKILFLIDEMAAITDGGTERQLLQLVEIASKNGLETQICALRGTEWLSPLIAGCNVRHCDIPRICSWKGLRSIHELTRWIREERFHIVQTFFFESNLLGPWVARAAKVPIVLGTRRNLNHSVKDGPSRVSLSIQWVSNLLVDCIIANSEAVLEKVSQSERLSREKICVVHNGIDLVQMRSLPNSRDEIRRRLGIGPSDILVCNISGLRRIKGVELFVQAAALAYSRDRRLRFVLVGDGELRGTIAQSIADHHLEKVFHLAGPVADVRSFLAAADIAVLCSMAEGFSNSLLEYMAAGLPVIATDVGGNQEALGSVGLLIEPGDAHALARAVLSFQDPSIRKREGSAALREVQKFDVRHAEARMREIYWHHLKKALKHGNGVGQNGIPGTSHSRAGRTDPAVRTD